ncbi:MAG: hypothetical protein M1536_00315, partial [Firmicutes bacterium]|nr:hypothetical protein [Bacillota bacterium]
TLARWLIIEASQVAVRVDGPLKSFYLRIRYKKGHNVAVVAAAKKMTCLIWQMLCKEEMYKWAPPLLTQEKLRKLELLAGMPREKSGPKKGKASEGGRPAYQAKRRVDKSMARIAQVQYEELVNQWKEKNPSKERQRLINQIVAGGDT